MKGRISGHEGTDFRFKRSMFFLSVYYATMLLLANNLGSGMTTEKQVIVVKSNKLIEASYRLDLIEQRIILAAIVRARETQTGLGDGFITLEARRFGKIFGMEEGSVYGQLKDAMDTLFNRFIVVRDIHPESGHERVS